MMKDCGCTYDCACDTPLPRPTVMDGYDDGWLRRAGIEPQHYVPGGRGALLGNHLVGVEARPVEEVPLPPFDRYHGQPIPRAGVDYDADDILPRPTLLDG